MGDSMAQLRAQPRLMTSVAFSVRLGSFWKASFRMPMMAGTLEDPPVTSTDATSSRLTPASFSACQHTANLSPQCLYRSTASKDRKADVLLSRIYTSVCFL